MDRRPTTGERVTKPAVAVMTALVLVGIAILPFLTPGWVAFEQGRARSTAWTGYTDAELRTATDAILHDLVVGPPDFAVTVRGAPVLDAREREHMRDVRVVFSAFAIVAVASALGLIAIGLARRGATRRAFWSGVRAGAVGLVAAMVVAGAVVALAFDAAFEVFHRLFFPAGSYTFDPRTERLVQIFPDAFWSETSLVLGAVILVFAAATAFVATRRLRRTPDDDGAVRATAAGTATG